MGVGSSAIDRAPDTWYSYECRAGCSLPTGVIVDMRIPNDYEEAPTVKCPLCGSPLAFRGRWAATEAGYGSSGDSPPLTVYPRFFEDLATTMVNNLTNGGLISGEQQYDAVVVRLTQQLRFQLNLQHTWREGDEVTSVRIRMDQP